MTIRYTLTAEELSKFGRVRAELYDLMVQNRWQVPLLVIDVQAIGEATGQWTREESIREIQTPR